MVWRFSHRGQPGPICGRARACAYLRWTPFIQRHEGEPDFQRYMKNEADTYFNSREKHTDTIHDTNTEDLFKLLNPNNYREGRLVLHTLRAELGDAQFFSGIA